jgi:hypothetical protein
MRTDDAVAGWQLPGARQHTLQDTFGHEQEDLAMNKQAEAHGSPAPTQNKATHQVAAARFTHQAGSRPK